MNSVREVLYVNYKREAKRVNSYGIEFREFISALDNTDFNILVLKGEYGTHFDFTTLCEYCLSTDIDEFVQENIYNYGDFSWVDFKEVDGLNQLVPQEIAELYYLSIIGFPVNETYFQKLENRFFYKAHDDGWYNTTYYHDEEDYAKVLTRVVLSKIKEIHHIDLPAWQEPITSKLLELSCEGLGIDINKVVIDGENKVGIPVYILGDYQDMDEVYDLCKEGSVDGDFKILYDGGWKICREN